MAHFFDPRTSLKVDFFVLKSCTTAKASLWNVGGPQLLISSDNPQIARLSSSFQSSNALVADPGVFNFFIFGVTPGNILLRAKTTSGNQWAFVQAVVQLGELCLDARGPAVEDLQRRLNQRSPTRLPRLTVSGRFDIATKARVMEFQFYAGLKPDGAVGAKTQAALGTKPTKLPSAPGGRCIVVDLINNVLQVFESGMQVRSISPIHGGEGAHPSTRGVFWIDPKRRFRQHTSSSYPIPPGNMNFSLFYNGPEAIHQGPGRIASKGCIHVSPPDAESLFNWVGATEVLVIVVK